MTDRFGLTYFQHLLMLLQSTKCLEHILKQQYIKTHLIQHLFHCISRAQQCFSISSFTVKVLVILVVAAVPLFILSWYSYLFVSLFSSLCQFTRSKILRWWTVDRVALRSHSNMILLPLAILTALLCPHCHVRGK